MNTFQGRMNALTGSACPNKASNTSYQSKSDDAGGYIPVIRTYYQVGDRQSVQAGDYGTAVTGDSGNAMAGESGFALAGDRGTAQAGDFGTAMVGEFGTAIVGDCGMASACDGGSALAGIRGIASAGYGGVVSAGEYGELRLTYWDSHSQRYRTAIGYIGENDLVPNTPYILSASHNFVPTPALEVARK